MAIVTFTYLNYNHSGTGVRHHHFSSANNLTVLPPHTHNGSTDSHPDNDSAFAPDTWGGLPFAFMSINSAADGNHLYTSPGNQSFLVGSSDVAVLVVYGPKSTPGPDGGPGIWVDAFNVDTGTFSDDLHFITVLTPPTPPDTIDTAKTNFANSDGSISTAAAEHIRASNAVDSGVPFLEWKQIIPPTVNSNSKDQDIKKNESGEIWFAFYQSGSGPSFRRPIGDLAYDPLWWLHSWWGHGPDPGPDEKWMQQAIAAYALAATATRVSPELREMVLKIAVKQLGSAAASIEHEISGRAN